MQRTQQSQSKPGRSAQMTAARVAKQDEFYTKLEDIRAECDRHADSFRGKNILCPCDGSGSNFIKYFEDNFDRFELASLVGVQCNLGGLGMMYVKNPGTPPEISPLAYSAVFQSPAVLKLLRACDVVVTNPPFSLFRSFVEHIVRFRKKFLLLGNMATIGSKEIEYLVMSQQLWFGYFGCSAMEFTLPDHYQRWMREEMRPDGSVQKYATVSSLIWATNLPVHKKLGHELTATYDPSVYKKYDSPHWDAIEVPALKKIPKDYFDTMGVPITFVVNWDPEQFEIIGFTSGNRIKGELSVDNENCFRRVLIKRKT